MRKNNFIKLYLDIDGVLRQQKIQKQKNMGYIIVVIKNDSLILVK